MSFDWSSVASAGGSLFGSLISGIFNSVTNSKNREAALRENAINREREDNQLQRRVVDAQAAGLSPLAVLESGFNPAQVTVPYAQSPDLSALNQLGTNLAATMTARENQRISEKKIDNEQSFNESMISLQNNAQNIQQQQFYAEMQQKASQFAEQIKSAEKVSRESNDTKMAIQKLSDETAKTIAMAKIKAEFDLQKDEQVYNNKFQYDLYVRELAKAKNQMKFELETMDKQFKEDRHTKRWDRAFSVINSVVVGTGASLINGAANLLGGKKSPIGFKPN